MDQLFYVIFIIANIYFFAFRQTNASLLKLETMFARGLQILASVGVLLARNIISEAFHINSVATTSAEGHLFHAVLKYDGDGDDYMDYNTDYVADFKEFLRPHDPFVALRCKSFACFLSKFDLMKTEVGYSLKEMQVNE